MIRTADAVHDARSREGKWAFHPRALREPEDADALKRARAEGHSAADLIRRGLRIVAAGYYRGPRRRPPTTRLFDPSEPWKLGDESELFADLERP